MLAPPGGTGMREGEIVIVTGTGTVLLLNQCTPSPTGILRGTGRTRGWGLGWVFIRWLLGDGGQGAGVRVGRGVPSHGFTLITPIRVPSPGILTSYGLLPGGGNTLMLAPPGGTTIWVKPILTVTGTLKLLNHSTPSPS